MVARGVVWASGLVLGVAFVACAGRSIDEPEGEGGEAGEVTTGGRSSSGGRAAGGRGPAGGVGASTSGGVSGNVAVGGTSGGAVGGSGGADVPSGGTSGTSGMCTEGVSQGGWTGADGCPIPWWGMSLDGARGLFECPAPNDPSLLAYGQTNQPPCHEITGPVAEIRSSEGLHSCCYHFNDFACCGGSWEEDVCIEVPYFGDGTTSVSLPTGQLDDPFYACENDFGTTVELTRAEAAEQMIGVWLACDEMLEPFVGNGFIFRGDGTFHAIDFNADLELSESEGCMQGGLWGFYSDTGQLNLYTEDSTRIVFPTFTSGPEQRLRLDFLNFVRAVVPGGG